MEVSRDMLRWLGKARGGISPSREETMNLIQEAETKLKHLQSEIQGAKRLLLDMRKFSAEAESQPSRPGRRRAVCGNPRRMTTSYVERHNWTLRGINRRMTRLSNGFSWKLENLKAQVALGYDWYNLRKPHKGLGGRIPAMALGVWPGTWSLGQLVA